MDQSVFFLIIGVICISISGNLGTVQSDADKLNGKALTIERMSGVGIKSAIPYSDGQHLEVTLWMRTEAGHTSVLCLLKKSSTNGYEYAADGFHVAIDGVGIDKSDRRTTDWQTKILNSINAALGSVALPKDTSDTGTYRGNARFKKVINKLRTGKSLEVSGKTWGVVGATTVSAPGGEVWMVFVAKHHDEASDKHYSNLVVVETKGQKLSVRDVLAAENGKLAMTMDETYANGESITEALNKLNQ